MCGIVGIADRRGRDELAALVEKMNAVIAHRGPDDRGTHSADGLALAMCRLSIIDIGGGHQPKYTGDGVAIVFNGEIYNYLALRDELVARGYAFETRSDTEVILKLYHADGIGAFKRLHGMFTVAIHDTRSNELVLARDHTGIKPLYYKNGGGALWFASEIKAILAVLPAKPPIDRQSLWDYLSLRYVPPPRTIWDGIRKLEPGHILRHSLATGRTETIRYWAPDLTPEPFDPGRDYAKEFEQQFLAAVEAHIVASDVPVGTFLSGGLDSGAICAAAIELGHKNFHTFSISGEGAGADDELPLARLVSQRYGTCHHEIVMSPGQYFDQLDTVAWHFDEPYGDYTGTALYLLARLARDYVKVAMSGEGSDELLLGYINPNILSGIEAAERRYGRIPPALLRVAARVIGGRRGKILDAVASGGPGAYIKGAASHISWTFGDEEKKAIWRGARERPSHDLISSWYTLPVTLHPFVQTQQADFQTWLVEDLLMKADKMAMAVSLETRVPFLHVPLVEWCQRTPLEARIALDGRGGFRTKAVLRDFVARRLPCEVLEAPKRGFALPVLAWFCKILRDRGALELRSKGIREYVAVELLEPVVASAARGERKALEMLWVVLMLDRWFAAYAD